MHFTSCQILKIMNIEEMQRRVEKGKSQNFRSDDDLRSCSRSAAGKNSVGIIRFDFVIPTFPKHGKHRQQGCWIIQAVHGNLYISSNGYYGCASCLLLV